MEKYDRDPILATLSSLLGVFSVFFFMAMGFFTFIPATAGMTLGIIEYRISKKQGFKENSKKALQGIIVNLVVCAILLFVLFHMLSLRL